jgi:hypothetical protein
MSSTLVSNAASKVTVGHLQRTAFLYVRQSTLRQVMHNTESTQRQYALRQRAIQLGWPVEQIVVIDTDQGQSGASASDREGFQRLVADVGLGKAGIVLASRSHGSRATTSHADVGMRRLGQPRGHADFRRKLPANWAIGRREGLHDRVTVAELALWI